MINILRTLIVVGLLVGTPATLLAVDEIQTNPVIVEGEDGETRPTQEVEQNFQKKLETEKQKFDDKLDANRARQVAAKCQVAQNKIGPITTRTKAFQENHTEIQNRWRNKLGELADKLDAAGINTVQLRLYLAEYDNLMEQAKTGFKAYMTGLEGVSTMKCADDPEGFYESLQGARAARSLVVDSLKESKSYIQSTIKAELLSIKDQLINLSAGEDGEATQ